MSAYSYRWTVKDCNVNLIPDDCDIADGTSVDENANAIPDECESLAVFIGCLAGPVGVPGSLWNRSAYDCRRSFDHTADSFVDLRDWSNWTAAFVG